MTIKKTFLDHRKIRIFSKGLAHDFRQNVKLDKIGQRDKGSFGEKKKAFLVYKNIIVKKPNSHFSERGPPIEGPVNKNKVFT